MKPYSLQTNVRVYLDGSNWVQLPLVTNLGRPNGFDVLQPTYTDNPPLCFGSRIALSWEQPLLYERLTNSQCSYSERMKMG